MKGAMVSTTSQNFFRPVASGSCRAIASNGRAHQGVLRGIAVLTSQSQSDLGGVAAAHIETLSSLAPRASPISSGHAVFDRTNFSRATGGATPLRPYHVQQWVDSYADFKCTTKRNYVRSVKRCSTWAMKQGYTDSDPLVHLDVPGSDRKELVLTDEQYQVLLENCTTESFRDLLVVTRESCGRKIGSASSI